MEAGLRGEPSSNSHRHRSGCKTACETSEAHGCVRSVEESYDRVPRRTSSQIRNGGDAATIRTLLVGDLRQPPRAVAEALDGGQAEVVKHS